MTTDFLKITLKVKVLDVGMPDVVKKAEVKQGF